jgi:hypothetical protein
MTLRKQHSKEQTGPRLAAVSKAAAKPLTDKQAEQGMTGEQRHSLVAEAAYLIAEQRGFQGDLALQDWLQAEAAIAARFSARH